MIDIRTVREEVDDLDAGLAVAQEQMAGYLRELGFNHETHETHEKHERKKR